jgi:tetratricopeptide (TPR) repeat protein
MIRWFEGRYEEALATASEGLEMARELNAPPLIFSNQLWVANALHGMGRIEEAIESLRHLEAFLSGDLENDRLGSMTNPRSTVFAFTSWFMNATGEHSEALDFATRSLEIALREQDLYSEVLARNTMGRNLLLLGRTEEAVRCLRVASDLIDRNGYDAIKANLMGAMAAALARTGEAAEAVRLVRSCLKDELHLRTGRMEVGWLYAGYAEALVSCGDPEAGFSALEDALRIARAIGNPWLLADCLGLRAHLRARIDPGNASIRHDLDEQRATCERYGIAIWSMAAPRDPAAFGQPA